MQQQQPVAQQSYQQPAPSPQDSLIHPLLMRNGDSRPLQRPTTPLPSLDLLTPPPSEVEPVDTFALEQMARLVEARLADFRIKADELLAGSGDHSFRAEPRAGGEGRAYL